MGGPFDGAGAQSQSFGHGVVVNRFVAVVALVREHLPGLAQGAAQEAGTVVKGLVIVGASG